MNKFQKSMATFNTDLGRASRKFIQNTENIADRGLKHKAETGTFRLWIGKTIKDVVLALIFNTEFDEISRQDLMEQLHNLGYENPSSVGVFIDQLKKEGLVESVGWGKYAPVRHPYMWPIKYYRCKEQIKNRIKSATAYVRALQSA